MASKLNFTEIRNEIVTILSNNITRAKYLKESESIFGVDAGEVVGVYVMNWDAPAGMQRLAAGGTLDLNVSITVRCFGFDLSSLQKASEKRDSLMSDVVQELIKNRDLNGTVETSWPSGGEMAAVEENGFISWGDVNLVTPIRAKT